MCFQTAGELYNDCRFVPMFSSIAHKIVPRSRFVRVLDALTCARFFVVCTLNYARILLFRTLDCAQFLLHPFPNPAATLYSVCVVRRTRRARSSWSGSASPSPPRGSTATTSRASGARSTTSSAARTRPSRRRSPASRWRSWPRTRSSRRGRWSCSPSGRRRSRWRWGGEDGGDTPWGGGGCSREEGGYSTV